VSVNEGEGLSLDLPGAPPREATLPLKSRDPERYGSLTHPGDDYSYDIATQVAELARAGDLLRGTRAHHVVLAGESQSAGRLASYVNAIHPIAKTYDGFLVHSRGSRPAAVAEALASQQPTIVQIRTDLDVPVFQFETEGDVAGALQFLPARQPDTDRLVTWEVAGTAHADDSIAEYGRRSAGVGFDIIAICGATNTGPHGEVLRAGFVAFTRWIDDGTKPPASPLLATTDGTLARDEYGNALGGIRTPDVDAPIATLLGVNDKPNAICRLFGDTIPFTAEQLDALYPRHADYVRAVTEAADATREAGFLLRADRNTYVAEAKEATIPG
jgi:hypothetical protein